jgi:predicted ester cyclase
MSGDGEAGAAPAGNTDPSAARPAERQRPAHVVPGGSDSASGPGVPAFVAAVHARDAAAARATISTAFQGKANGRPMDADAQVRLLESFWTGFPDGNFTMEPTGGSGRYVITWTFQGTHGGMYLGVPPTGTPVAFSGYIIAVADKSGVTSLDWKWDTKVFTRAVLGPDQVGDLEVKDNFRDPSRRWQHDGRGASHGQGRRKKSKGGRQGQPGQGRQQGGRAEGSPAMPPTEPGQAGPGEPGQPGQPGQRQRRPKKPRGPDVAALPAAESAERAEAPAAQATPSDSAVSADSATGPSKPDGT